MSQDHDHDDDPLRQLEIALSIKPSPDFAARVRERVKNADEKPARTAWMWWLSAGAAVAAAVAIAAVVVWHGGATEQGAGVPFDSAQGGRPASAEVRGAGAPPSTSLKVASAGVPFDAAQGRRTVTSLKPGLAAIPTSARPPHKVIRVASREPEVLVPPDEGIAIRSLLRAIQQGRATVPAVNTRVMEDADGHLLEATSIDIPLIKIEPLPETPVPDSGGIKK